MDLPPLPPREVDAPLPTPDALRLAVLFPATPPLESPPHSQQTSVSPQNSDSLPSMSRYSTLLSTTSYDPMNYHPVEPPLDLAAYLQLQLAPNARHAPTAVLECADLTVLLCSYLPLRDARSLLCLTTRTAALYSSETLWRGQFPHTSPAWAPPPPPFQTWQLAVRTHAAYHAPSLAALDTRGCAFTALHDVTCPCYGSGYAAFGFADGRVKVYGPSGGAPLDFQLPSGSIRHMAFVGRKLYAGCWNGAVHSLELGKNSASPIVTRLAGPVFGLGVEEHTLFTCCGDGNIQMWWLKGGGSAGIRSGHTAGVTDFALIRPSRKEREQHRREALRSSGGEAVERGVHPKLRLVSTSYDSTVRVWSPSTCVCLAVLSGHKGPSWSIAVSATNLLTASADGSVRVWSNEALYTRPLEGGVPPPPFPMCVRVIRPYGPSESSQKQLFCNKVFGDVVFMGSSCGTVFAYNLETGTRLWELAVSPGDGIRRLDVVGDRLYTCTSNGNVFAHALRFLEPGTGVVSPAKLGGGAGGAPLAAPGGSAFHGSVLWGSTTFSRTRTTSDGGGSVGTVTPWGQLVLARSTTVEEERHPSTVGERWADVWTVSGAPVEGAPVEELRTERLRPLVPTPPVVPSPVVVQPKPVTPLATVDAGEVVAAVPSVVPPPLVVKEVVVPVKEVVPLPKGGIGCCTVA